MKKALLMIAVLLSLTACEKAILNDVDTEDEQTEVSTKTKKFKFTVKGDFGTATFTRGYLQADGQDMTDLWVFDFMNGECVQSLHQTNDDADFGKPTMKLAYGSHHVYFVASRGDSPVLDEEATTIVWAKAKDSKEKSPFEKESVYRVKVRFPLEKDGMTGDELISRMGVYVTQIISCGESNAQTEALLNEYKKEIFIDSPVLGKLVLDKGLGSYMGNAKWNGSDIDILIDHDEDTEESIPMLEEFFRNSAENDAVLRKFAASELTGLANEWLADSEDGDEEEQKEITEEEFARRISPDGINFSSDGTYSFYFYDDDMFWGHSVTVYGSVTEGPDEANIEG